MPKPTSQRNSPKVSVQSNLPVVVKPGGITERLANAWNFTERITLNIYGKSGTGKTTLWATFPKPILAIICSGGNQPGELKSINTAEYRSTIHPYVVNSSSDVSELLELVRGGSFATTVLDHASGLQDLKLKEILGLKELPAQLSWGIASQQQYGQLALQMKETLRAILDLPGNIVIVAQERDFNTSNDGANEDILQPYVASALSPSVVGWLNPAVEYVCQSYVRMKTIEKRLKIGNSEQVTRQKTNEVEYCLRTYPNPTYASKFRVPKGTKLPECIVDPTYDKLMALIQGGG